MRKTAALRATALSPAEAEAIAPPLPSPAAEPRSSKLLLGITIAGMLVIPLFMYAGV
ncbi:MAG: hypothetical protein QOH21_3509, partial [Acidobacteriota bacterium]|nr:hypothetical protein [Acidobacteriota bacterium]